MRLEWTPDLSVNNNKIDREHKQWIELFNNFYDGVVDKKPKEKLEELILGMLDYTKYHFKSEEEFMQSINYPGITEHKENHAIFINKIEEFHKKISGGKFIISVEVTNFLKTWLINHIKGTDIKYARFADQSLIQKH